MLIGVMGVPTSIGELSYCIDRPGDGGVILGHLFTAWGSENHLHASSA
jgi:hypothetical protein